MHNSQWSSIYRRRDGSTIGRRGLIPSPSHPHLSQPLSTLLTPFHPTLRLPCKTPSGPPSTAAATAPPSVTAASPLPQAQASPPPRRPAACRSLSRQTSRMGRMGRRPASRAGELLNICSPLFLSRHPPTTRCQILFSGWSRRADLRHAHMSLNWILHHPPPPLV